MSQREASSAVARSVGEVLTDWVVRQVDGGALPLLIGDGGNMPVPVGRCAIDVRALAEALRRRALANHDVALLGSFKRCYPDERDPVRLETALEDILYTAVADAYIWVLLGLAFGADRNQWVDLVLSRAVQLARCPGSVHQTERDRLFTFGRRRVYCSELCSDDGKDSKDRRRGSRKADAQRYRARRAYATISDPFRQAYQKLLEKAAARTGVLPPSLSEALTAEDVRIDPVIQDDLIHVASRLGMPGLATLIRQIRRHRKPIPKSARKVR